ncbi:E3 ubiquitin-protein ligase LNX-like [Brevipalpus obovatus]|uniref:E3 ubiquitin-protein ligase LNX-like n=1 Tax=Brevipalpus obovatus TaxID=246614 RepID=UPI003D9EE68D
MASQLLQLLQSMDSVEVKLTKNSRGIGMRVCGGIDVKSDDFLDHLVRVKCLFPREPAMESGLIDVGDIILEANGQNLVGVTSIESMNILHSTKDVVTLKILKPKTYATRLDRSHLLSPNHSLSSSPCNSLDTFIIDLELVKKDGSLGFTITQIDHEGFFVKELTKEPAILDPRISPSDKILRVNGAEVSSMSCSEVVTFLRSLPDEVHLTLEKRNRPPSPCIEDDEKRLKKQLRHEARMMITDHRSKNESILKTRRDRRRTRDLSEAS